MNAAAIKVSIVILISRVFGYFRDMCVAAFIGAGPISDAMMAAFKLTNLFRSIFSEGAMSSALIPTLSQSIKSHGERYTRVVTYHIFSMLLLILSIFTLFIFYQMENFIYITNPGFKHNSEIFNLAVELAYIMFPYLILISAAAFYGSILQIKGVFTPYAFTSIIMNITIICVLYMSNLSSVHSFAYGLILSGVLELIWMIFFAHKYNAKLLIRKPVFSKYFRLTLKRILPGIFASSMTQISVWCDMIILSFFSGGISYLYFADRIIQLPLAIFSTAISIILLPLLSKNSEMKDITLNKSLRFTLCFILPSASGIFMLSEEIVSVLFVRGAFNSEAASNTIVILKILCFALPFQAISKIYTSAIHSSGNLSITVKFSSVSLFFNILLSVILMKKLGFQCVAVATIFSSAIQAILLICYSYNKISEFKMSLQTIQDFIKYICGVCIMIYMITLLKNLFIHNDLIKLILCIVLGGICYSIILIILKVQIQKDFLK